MADEKKTIKFQMMMSPAEAEAIDDWGFSKRIRSRAEAIRRLVQLGTMYDDCYKYAVTGSSLVSKLMKGDIPSPDLIADYIEVADAFIKSMDKTNALTRLIKKDHYVDQILEQTDNMDRETAQDLAEEMLREREKQLIKKVEDSGYSSEEAAQFAKRLRGEI